MFWSVPVFNHKNMACLVKGPIPSITNLNETKRRAPVQQFKNINASRNAAQKLYHGQTTIVMLRASYSALLEFIKQRDHFSDEFRLTWTQGLIFNFSFEQTSNEFDLKSLNKNVATAIAHFFPKTIRSALCIKFQYIGYQNNSLGCKLWLFILTHQTPFISMLWVFGQYQNNLTRAKIPANQNLNAV